MRNNLTGCVLLLIAVNCIVANEDIRGDIFKYSSKLQKESIGVEPRSCEITVCPNTHITLQELNNLEEIKNPIKGCYGRIVTLCNVVFPNNTIYPNFLNSNLDNITEIHLNSTCPNIETNAFKSVQFASLKKLWFTLSSDFGHCYFNLTVEMLNGLETMETFHIHSSSYFTSKTITVEENIFRNFSKLQNIYLKQIKALKPVKNITGSGVISNVKEVWIFNGDFPSVPPYLFQGVPNLKTLYIHDTHVRFIENNAFAGLENLETLDLEYNKFTHLYEKDFAHLKNLKHIDVRANPLVCDCTLKWMKNKIDSLPDCYIQNGTKHVPILQYLRENCKDEVSKCGLQHRLKSYIAVKNISKNKVKIDVYRDGSEKNLELTWLHSDEQGRTTVDECITIPTIVTSLDIEIPTSYPHMFCLQLDNDTNASPLDCVSTEEQI